jgi:hypothetical protein
LRRTRFPALQSHAAPEADRLLAAQLPAAFQKRYLLPGDQLADGDLEVLLPAVVAARLEVEHLAPVTEPALLGRKRRSVAVSNSSRHLRRPTPLSVQIIRLAAAAVVLTE